MMADPLTTLEPRGESPAARGDIFAPGTRHLTLIEAATPCEPLRPARLEQSGACQRDRGDLRASPSISFGRI